jgi:hypothetical protein
VARRSEAEKKRDDALGVRVEAKYTVGEYDILILGAKQSEGLETWLRENGYRVPPKAAAALQPYIRQDMKFFVAKVNLEAQKESGVQYLRPLQIAYESKKFMLPIRLGMANAAGPQDMIVYALTRRGRVESVNYRTTRIPSDVNIPVFVKSDFGKFYQDAFARSVEKEDRRAVFTEYVWDMGWCDPCAAQPLSRQELRQLGVFWLDDPRSDSLGRRFAAVLPRAGRSTCSSPVSTSATTALTSPRTWCSRRRRTGPTSRPVTSSSIRTRGPRTAAPWTTIASGCVTAGSRRPRPWPRSPGGRCRTSRRRWGPTART